MLHRMTAAQWNEVIFVNLASIFNMSRHVIDGMRERGYGRIINITSINGQKGQMGQTNYSAAKAGVIGFTKALAQETANKADHRERGGARAISTPKCCTRCRQNVHGSDHRRDSGGPAGQGGGDRRLRGLSRPRGRLLHHRAPPDRANGGQYMTG